MPNIVILYDTIEGQSRNISQHVVDAVTGHFRPVLVAIWLTEAVMARRAMMRCGKRRARALDTVL